MTHAVRVVTSENDTLLVGGEDSFPDTDDSRERLGVGTKVSSKDRVFGAVGGNIVSSKGGHLPSVAVNVSKSKVESTKERELTQMHPRAFVVG